MRRIEACAGVATLFLLCARGEEKNSNPSLLVEDLQPKYTQILSPFQQSEPTIPVNLAPTVEVTSTPNSTSDIGKNRNSVGAMIVNLPDVVVPKKADYQTEMIVQDSRFVETKTGIVESDLEFLGKAEKVGKNRYRLPLRYQGRTSDFYYYDPYGGLYIPSFEKQVNFKWGDYLVPLYRQLDPRWAGIKLDKTNHYTGLIETFGTRGCGLTVAASVFSMVLPGDETTLIDPYQFYQAYVPSFDGSGTVTWNYMDILRKRNLNIEVIYPTKVSIEKAIDTNKLVILDTSVNFKVYGSEKSTVKHFVLILGRDKEGELLIYDPFWGSFVTTFADLDLSDPESSALAIGYPQ